MIRLVRDFRLVPIVLIATICLFVLKSFGLIFEGGYVLGDIASSEADDGDITGAIPGSPSASRQKSAPKARPAPKSWAQEMFNYPDITGSVSPPKAASEAAKPAKAASGPQDPPASNRGWIPVPVEPEKTQSLAERAILERLQERRAELDARAKELDMQEGLLKAAEKRLEGRINELKELEARVNAAVKAKDDAEAARFKNLITMYENMKAKDAAKIFDRLDRGVLLDVATQINPRRMSEILAQMSPEAAERLTVEMANRAANKEAPAELPKIEGKAMAN